MMNDFLSFVWDALSGEGERRMRRSEERRIRAKEDLMSRLESDADGLIAIDSRPPSRLPHSSFSSSLGPCSTLA